MKETIYYKRTEYKKTEHKLEIDPTNCFMKSNTENNGGYKYIGVLPKGNRFVLIQITDTTRGVEIKFDADKKGYINRFAYQKFAESNDGFSVITKEEFIKTLKERLDWHTDKLLQLNLDN